MGDAGYIRTPWRLHRRRIRQQLVPVIAFAGASAMTVWLWSRHTGLPTVVGEVETVRFDIAFQIDGLLVPARDRPLEPFDVVRAGEIVAKLDDRPVLTALATLQAEVVQITGELAATEARVRQEQADRNHEFKDQARRLAVDVEAIRLDILDRKALIETDRILLRRLDEEYAAVRAAHELDAETDFRLITMQLERDEIERGIAMNQTALEGARIQHADSIDRIHRQPAPAPSYLDEQLAPVRAAITVQEARIDELEVQADSMEVRAPSRGTISEVFFRPGQVVTAGTPVLTIASETGRHIVAYIRNAQRLDPYVGMAVQVRGRAVRPQVIRTRIDRVGAQVEPVPLHQLRDPTRPEWGLPVRIAMPDRLSLRAGELVDIRLIGGQSPATP